MPYVSTGMYLASSRTYSSLFEMVGQWLDIQATSLGLFTKALQPGPMTCSKVTFLASARRYLSRATSWFSIRLGRRGLRVVAERGG